MLSKNDIVIIKSIFRELFREEFENARKILKEDITIFKDEILHKMIALEEDVAITTGYRDAIADHEIRLDKLEKRNN